MEDTLEVQLQPEDVSQTAWIVLLGEDTAFSELKNILEAHAYCVVMCADIQAFTQQLYQHPNGCVPSVIVTTFAELSLSRHTLTHNFAAIPVLALLEVGQSRSLVYSLGAVDYIALPLCDAELLTRVRAHAKDLRDTSADNPVSNVARHVVNGDVVQELDSLRQELELLRGLVDAMPMMLSIVDADGYYRYVNPARAALLHVHPDAMQGKTYADFHNNEHVIARWRQEDAEVIAGGEAKQIEQPIGGVPHRVLLFPIYNQQQKVIARGMVGVEVSDLYRKMNELEQAQILIQRARLSKQHVLEDISHQLRTPLTSMLGFSDMLMLEAEELSEDVRSHIKAIQQEGYDLLHTFNTLRVKINMHSAHESLWINSVIFPLRDVLVRILDAIAEKCKRRHIDLYVDMQEDLPVYVRGDVLKLKEVLRYILINVITFGDHSALTAHIYSQQEHNTLVLSVDIAVEAVSAPQQGIENLIEKEYSSIFLPNGLDDSSEFSAYHHMSQLMGGSLQVVPQNASGTMIAMSFPFTMIAEQDKVGELVACLTVFKVRDVSLLYACAMEIDRHNILDFRRVLETKDDGLNWQKLEELLQYFVYSNDYQSIINACEVVLGDS